MCNVENRSDQITVAPGTVTALANKIQIKTSDPEPRNKQIKQQNDYVLVVNVITGWIIFQWSVFFQWIKHYIY